jgi:hypothetical protein
VFCIIQVYVDTLNYWKNYLFSYEGDEEERQKAGSRLVYDYNIPACSA